MTLHSKIPDAISARKPKQTNKTEDNPIGIEFVDEYNR